MKTLLTSAEFRDSAGQKYKTPYQLRAVGGAGRRRQGRQPDARCSGRWRSSACRSICCPTPDGYKNTEDAWLSPDATTLRINFATLVGSGALLDYVAADGSRRRMWSPPPTAPDAEARSSVDAAALEALLSPILTDHARAAIAESPAALKAALILGSPDFMRR